MDFLRRLWMQMTRRKTLSGDVMKTELQRCLGTCELMLLGMGHMMGAGIYVITGTVVSNIAGPATVLSYAIAGFAAFLSSICYAEFAALIPKAGSAYSYTYVIMGEFWAFIIGWNIVLEHLMSVSSVARAWSATFITLLTTTSGNATVSLVNETAVETDQWLDLKPDFIGPLAVAAVTVFLVVGAKTSAGFNNILTVTNVLVILVVAVGGFYYADFSLWEAGGFMPYGVKGTIGGAALCFYAFIGFEGITIAGEEARDPVRSMPKAIMGAMALATASYVIATLALTLMVPYNEVDSAAAFPLAFGDMGVVWLKYVVSGGSLFGITASLLACGFALSRSVYALANDGVFFKLFSNVNSKTQTPVVSILVFNLFAAAMACLFEVEVLIQLMAIGTLLAYTIVAANVVVIRYCPDYNGVVSAVSENTEVNGHLPFHVTDSNGTSDREKILPSEKPKETGKLRPQFEKLPILGSFEPGKAVLCALFVMIVLIIITSTALALGEEELLRADWCMVLLIVILGLGIILTILIISVHQQHASSATFRLPFVPVIPAISIFLNVTLMLQLPFITWMRLIIWQTVGFVIYFAYGIRHSAENIPMGASNVVKYNNKTDNGLNSAE